MKGHNGSPASSRVMREAMRLMLRKSGATSLDIHKATGAVSPHSVVNRCRLFYSEGNGAIEVLPAEFVRTTENGSRVYRWRAVRK